MEPGQAESNIVRPAGPIEPDVFVIHFESSAGKPLGTYVNFAPHLDTVGGTEISADYPATMAAILARQRFQGC
jgi:neutral ceramidase